jgi:hypothetical protein
MQIIDGRNGPPGWITALERARKKPLKINGFLKVAEWTGLEPATPGVTGRYSNQLNYHSSAGFRPPFQLAQLALPAGFRIAPQALPNLASPRGFEPL